jgi:hypothetical protein
LPTRGQGLAAIASRPDQRHIGFLIAAIAAMPRLDARAI